MANENVTFVGVGRLRDQCILATLHERMPSSDKAELDTAFSGFLSEAASRMAAGGRDKRKLGFGVIYLAADNEGVCVYGVVVKGPDYPDRHAFNLLGELMTIVQGQGSGSSVKELEAGGLSRSLKRAVKDLMDRYDKPAAFDRTSSVRSKVESVKDAMQENVKKILENQANVETLQNKTENLASSASQFNKSAGDLSRMMWWRKVKVSILLGIVGLAIIGYIVLVVVNLSA